MVDSPKLKLLKQLAKGLAAQFGSLDQNALTVTAGGLNRRCVGTGDIVDNGINFVGDTAVDLHTQVVAGADTADEFDVKVKRTCAEYSCDEATCADAGQNQGNNTENLKLLHKAEGGFGEIFHYSAPPIFTP